ncbi:hypothetical protein [Streptomyces sp. NPDC048473]|uniref:hypothetical protein n=1 Tax=unclassified Streptomyces TaxID=2593676 RepID=UPI00371B3531
MAAESFAGHYVWHPAADDRQLAGACVDVRAGRYLGAARVLLDSRDDFGVRAHRSLVLASEAADSDLAERWLDEEPGPDSALLWARVAMLRALRSAEQKDSRAGQLTRIAFTACERAAALYPADPTPWVAQLALARLAGMRDPAPEGLMTGPPGPWRLFVKILHLDLWHREAHHRLLSYFHSHNGGSASARWDVATFLSHRAPANSALRLLPLVTLVEDYDDSVLLADSVWTQPQWRRTSLSIYHTWFPEVGGYRFTPVLDLAYLAHALHMARCEFEARAVLVAMGPYASRMPWHTFGDPAVQLSRTRQLCGLPVPD